jgi:hypothetical protein
MTVSVARVPARRSSDKEKKPTQAGYMKTRRWGWRLGDGSGGWVREVRGHHGWSSKLGVVSECGHGGALARGRGKKVAAAGAKVRLSSRWAMAGWSTTGQG